MPVEPGARLGPYQIQSAIGAGGMGEVYKATDTRLGRTVAIKVLPAELAADPERRERFEREAKTISRLQHPHICTLHDVGHQDGIDYLVMEHIEGRTLQQHLEKGALPVDLAMTCAIQIADALEKAHRQGVIHRDLKPGNIMLTSVGAKLLDFGLAKLRPVAPASGDGPTVAPTKSRPLTGSGTMVGTCQYMAPEQIEGGDADRLTDIFAFGALLYEMVSGKQAFEGASQASVFGAILEREPAPISTHQPMIPPLLDFVVRTCLAKDPRTRWDSIGDVRRQLEWMSESWSATTNVSPETRRRFSADTESADDTEYHEALKSAHERIWISQTWFPGVERDAAEILQSAARSLRIVLASFKVGAPIYSRIGGRRLKTATAKANVESSVKLLVENGNRDSLRFSYGHHPGWIAIIDSWVFWGPTPIHRDNHSIDFLFHKHPAGSEKGQFWIGQFELLWQHHSHDYAEEQAYNEELGDP